MIKIKLQFKQFYDDNFNKIAYENAQIKRHQIKFSKKRNAMHYKKCAENIIKFVSNNGSMICLGTRNNYERDVLAKELKPRNIKVYSLDISPLSGADYIFDFNELSKKNWINKWDAIFSNSLDHAVNATLTFYDWLKAVKPGGIMAIGFCCDNLRTEISSSDCCSFNKKTVDFFMKNNHGIFDLLCSFDVSGYNYYIIKKTS